MLPSFSTIQKHVGVCVVAEEVGEGWSKSRGGHAAKTYCRIKASVYDTLSYTAQAVSCESHCGRFKLASSDFLL